MVHDLRHVIPGRAALRGGEPVIAAGPGPAAPQLGQGQVRGEFPAAVPDRVPGLGGVAGKGDGIPGDLGRVAGAVAGADEHAGLPQPGEEILLAARRRGGGADLPSQRDPRCFLQAAPGRLLRFGPRRAAGSRPVTGRGRPQPVPLLRGQAGIADPVPLVAEPGTAPVLAGQHCDQVNVVIAVPDRHPADGLVFLAERASPVRCITSQAICAHSSSDSVLSSDAARIEQCHTGRANPHVPIAACGWLSSPNSRQKSRLPSSRSGGSSSAGCRQPATMCGSVCSSRRPGPYR